MCMYIYVCVCVCVRVCVRESDCRTKIQLSRNRKTTRLWIAKAKKFKMMLSFCRASFTHLRARVHVYVRAALSLSHRHTPTTTLVSSRLCSSPISLNQSIHTARARCHHPIHMRTGSFGVQTTTTASHSFYKHTLTNANRTYCNTSSSSSSSSSPRVITVNNIDYSVPQSGSPPLVGICLDGSQQEYIDAASDKGMMYDV